MVSWIVTLSITMWMLVFVVFLRVLDHEVSVLPEDRAMLGSNPSAEWFQRCRGGGEYARYLSSLFLPAMLQVGDKSILRILTIHDITIRVRSHLVPRPVCRDLYNRGFFETCFARMSVRQPNTDLPWFLSRPWLPFASGALGSFVAVCSVWSSR